MVDFLNDLRKDIEKKTGEDLTEMMLIDGLPSDVKQFVPTGSTLLDLIMTNRKDGGIPIGRCTVLSGLQSSGKSLLAMQICAQAQKKGGLAIYIDTESALDS